MNSAELKRAKRSLRTRIVSLRDAMPEPERVAAANEIERRTLELVTRTGPRVVMAYWAFGSEVPTGGVIAALADRGITVALPKIVGDELEVRGYSPGDPVTETTFGAREPAAGSTLDPQTIDVVLVPGVAFDREGYRIGYGRGFYDRFLLTTRPDTERVSAAFSLQLVDTVPRGAFDLPVDAVVAERETVHTGARSSHLDERSADKGSSS